MTDTPITAHTKSFLPPLVDAFDAVITNLNVRSKEYGRPLQNFQRTAAIKAAVADCPDPILRHVLEMIGVKMSRLVQTPDHLDSWVDIAGYARTAVMILDDYRNQDKKDAPK